MGSVTKSLAAMGVEQLLLTMFFLAAYACALQATPQGAVGELRSRLRFWRLWDVLNRSPFNGRHEAR